jgi:hypothetical protein
MIGPAWSLQVVYSLFAGFVEPCLPRLQPLLRFVH